MNVVTAHRSAWIIVGLVTFVVVALMAFFWECSDPAAGMCLTVERIATVVTILSLTISPGLYFAKQRYSDKAEGERAATAVYMELGDAHDGLDPDRHRDLRVVTLPDQGKVYFMSRLLNHDIYDGLVNSGKITFIAAELQQDIQNVFQRIKDHNTLLRKVRKIQEAGGSHPYAIHLYHSLGGSDDALRDSVPETMRKIEAEYVMPRTAKARRTRSVKS